MGYGKVTFDYFYSMANGYSFANFTYNNYMNITSAKNISYVSGCANLTFPSMKGPINFSANYISNVTLSDE